MKKKMILACAWAALMVAMFSCGNLLESSDNGKLDGMWQLMQIDTLATGGSKNMKEDRKYVSVQGSMLQMHDVDDGVFFIFRFSNDDNRLTLSDARYNDRTAGDPLVTDVEKLRPYGVNALNEVFVIETLSSSRMILTSGMLRLIYRKI